MGPRWVIGWAMVGRAEFAYFIAILSKSLKMMEDSLFAILIWALIYATIFAPLIFRKVLGRYMVAEGLAQQNERKPGFIPTARASGHLPDMEEIAIAESEAQFERDYSELERKLKQKNEELLRLKSAKSGDTGESNLDQLNAELKAK